MIEYNLRDGFVWKDICSEDMSLVCESLPQKNTAETRMEQIKVPGRSGFLTVEKEGHEPITKSITFHLLDEQSLDQLKQWLQGTSELVLSNEPDRYYKATIMNKVEFEEVIPILHKGVIEFECQPYGYLFDGNSTSSFYASDSTIYNPGNYKSEPYIKVYGSGTIVLTINDQILTLKDVSEYVEIDTDLDMIFKGTESKDSSSSGDTPTLQPGLNTISWSGSVTQVDIIPRWRCL